MWPGGDKDQARVLGEMTVTNDGEGTTAAGNYDATIFKSPEYSTKPGIWKRGRVVNFPRQAHLGFWDLLYRALRSCIGNRNP